MRGGMLLYALQAIRQTCHATGVIDAEIAEKGHLWTETNLPLAEPNPTGLFVSLQLGCVAVHQFHEDRGDLDLFANQVPAWKSSVIQGL